jgi:hypothetical protein
MTKPKSQAPGTYRIAERNAVMGHQTLEFSTPTGRRQYENISKPSIRRLQRFFERYTRKHPASHHILWWNNGMMDWVLVRQPVEEVSCD